MFDIYGFILTIGLLSILFRRLYIRLFWVSAAARVVRRPELPKWGFLIGVRIWVELSYKVGPDSVRGLCRFPLGVPEEGEHPWDNSVGVTVPIYYCASNPERVIFIGKMWLWGEKMIFTKGWEVEMLLAGALAFVLISMISKS